MKRDTLVVALVLAVCLGSCSVAIGATLVVHVDGGAGYADIQSALDAAGNGDTVVVEPGE